MKGDALGMALRLRPARGGPGEWGGVDGMTRQPQYLVEQQRELGRYLAALRKAAGLYQSDIARAVPCHRTTVSHAEAGSQLPDSYFWELADQVTDANGALTASL